jgi:glutathione synthase/RimK-type ligase-like ATP-grasp enzyme
MVLLYGIPGDGPFELIADALEDLKRDFVILDQRKFNQLDFIYQLSSGKVDGEITIGSRSWQLSSFTGIYNRGVDFTTLPEVKDWPVQSVPFLKYQQLFTMINEWIETADCVVINKGSAMSSNSSKPYQMKLIAEFFMVPDTCITNSVPQVMAFKEEKEQIIYKSASSIRSIVKTVENENTLERIRYCPTMFQQRLEGTNYRVHVVNEEVYAVKVDSETVDYRYSRREGGETVLQAIELDESITSKCIALAKQLRLTFAGIDLFLSNEGEWYCFEVNPSPGFSYFENETGQPIAKAVAGCLGFKGLRV